MEVMHLTVLGAVLIVVLVGLFSHARREGLVSWMTWLLGLDAVVFDYKNIHLMEQVAGPHGKTIVRALLIKLGKTVD